MKILCIYTPAGPSFVRSGWGRVFASMGHDFRFWSPETKPAFDAFNEFEPDLFIGTTYELDRATRKCIAKRPNMKVIMYASAWGPYLKDVDLEKYPLVVASEQEKLSIELLKKQTGKPDFVFIHAHKQWLEGTMSGWRSIGVEPYGILNAADTFVYLSGEPKRELMCDVGFVGGYWGYKSRNLNKYITPLCHPSKKLNIKIFGNQPWPVHQYLGQISDIDARDLFATATICLNVSEPHSTDLGWDVVERPFKVFAAGGFCMSDFVAEAHEIFGIDMPMFYSAANCEEMVRHFVVHPEARLPLMEACRRKVLLEHTYFDRVCDFFIHLNMPKEAAQTLKMKGHYLQGQL